MNIVLIGMPGSGKSTVGVLLAKALLCHFVDTDLIIQAKHGKSLCEIINEIGIDGFIKTENEILSQQSFENTVVATGGSAVYGKEAMNNLKKNGIVVYIKLPPEVIESRINNITTRGIAMPEGFTIKQLYDERAPLYEKYADVTVDCSNLDIEETVKRIADAVNSL